MIAFLICTVIAILAGYMMDDWFPYGGWEIPLFTVMMGLLMGDNEIVHKLAGLSPNRDPSTSYVLAVAFFTLIAIGVSLWRAWVRAGKRIF